MSSEEQLKNRLKLIHNKTLCDLLRLFNTEPHREYSIEELKTKSKLNSSTLFNSLKKLKKVGYIEQLVRGHYKINYIVGPSLIKMLDELEKNKLPNISFDNRNGNYLSLLRRYKNPDIVFSKLLTTYRTIKISDLIDSGVSRATAFRILKELTNVGLLIKNEKEKNWQLSSNIDFLRRIIVQEITQIPGKILNIFQILKKNLPEYTEYIGSLLCSLEGFPIFVHSIEKKISDFSAWISAQMNVATQQCAVVDYELKFFINFIEKGLIIAYPLKKITLAMVFHTKNNLKEFHNLIQIINDAVEKIDIEVEKLKIEL
ncbi:MAG: hypothetical protein HWN67_08360 [Candidatus Helarchaeota archaeon]|nr:hypothetical protein [Candidatus Helarchaeota archaeon]